MGICSTLHKAARKYVGYPLSRYDGDDHAKYDAFVEGAQSNAAKQLHTKNMYTEDQLLSILQAWSLYKAEVEITNLTGLEFEEILSYDVWFKTIYKK